MSRGRGPERAVPRIADAKQRCFLLRASNRDAEVLIILDLFAEHAGRRWHRTQDGLDVLGFEWLRLHSIPAEGRLSFRHQLHRAHAVASDCLQQIESAGRSSTVAAAYVLADARVV